MKNIVLILTYIMIGVLTIGIVLSMLGRQNRSTEIKSNLSAVVEEAVENAMKTKKYDIADQNEFISDIAENVSSILDTKSDIIIDIMGADQEKGILSLKVTEKFSYLNGKNGSVSCDRTVVFEKGKEDDDEQFTVKFYIDSSDEKPYKTYIVQKGDDIRKPKDPVKVDSTFAGWKDGNETMFEAGKTADSDVNYYAVWN